MNFSFTENPGDVEVGGGSWSWRLKFTLVTSYYFNISQPESLSTTTNSAETATVLLCNQSHLSVITDSHLVRSLAMPDLVGLLAEITVPAV